jgi:DNA (cytosine-5)-methyltransferase 1
MVAATLTANYGKQIDSSDTSKGPPNLILEAPPIAFTERTRAGGRTLEAQEDIAYALTNPGNGGRSQERNIAGDFGVRRLTPTECERLQGFPDGWTAQGVNGPQADSARYRQLGNAVAVPVARWIGQRLMEAL